jgi:hypothetical protein
MRRLASWLLIVVSMLWALPLLAQDSDEPSETTYDFDDDVVEGQLVRPDGDMISGNVRGRISSLITIREEFIDKLIESVDDL